MKTAILSVLALGMAVGVPASFGHQQKQAGRGRLGVLRRLDQNIGRAIENVALDDKQKSTLEQGRQGLQQAIAARRDGLKEDKKATDKAFKEIEKIFKDKKVAFKEEDRKAVQNDIAELRADSRNDRPRQARVPRNPRAPGPIYRPPRRPL